MNKTRRKRRFMGKRGGLMTEKRKWKECCDVCGQYKHNCHGYSGEILCPECAAKKGFKEWRPDIIRKEN